MLRMLQSPIGMIGPGAAGVTGLMALDETFRNDKRKNNIALGTARACLLYTSDAADE